MPWKEAATLIATGRMLWKGNVQKCADYQTLMLKRSGKSNFGANKHVFPGGKISDSDHSKEWISIYENSSEGVKAKDLFSSILDVKTDLPEILSKSRSWSLPAPIAFRICAIRETFEESGILLVRDKSQIQEAVKSKYATGLPTVIPKVTEWRKKVHNDDSAFLDLCKTYEFVPDIWALRNWSNWLTPAVEKRRFDTMFFVACMDSVPHAVEDAGETTQATWYSPSEAIEAYQQERILLMPPQVYELAILQNFNSIDSLMEYLPRHEKAGIKRCLPVICLTKCGVMTVYPGDDFYPKDAIEAEAKEEFVKMDKTFEELTKESKCLNRLLWSDKSFGFRVNVPRALGQLLPVEHSKKESKL